MKRFLVAVLVMAPTCVAATQQRVSNEAVARIGQTVVLGSARITPMSIVEDSRCPTGVSCFWIGQLVVRVRIQAGASSRLENMTLGQSDIAAGTGGLAIVGATPERSPDRALTPREYRLRFRLSPPRR